MPVLRQIRADFDAATIVVYQAYPPAIADAALAAGRFVPPFSFTRMTWIRPSLLWPMHRSDWAQTRAGAYPGRPPEPYRLGTGACAGRAHPPYPGRRSHRAGMLMERNVTPLPMTSHR